jgi:hypothetical protein
MVSAMDRKKPGGSMRGVPFLVCLWIVASGSTAFGQTRITELPDGNILIEITGSPGPSGTVARQGAEPALPAHPEPDGVAPPAADPGRAASLQAEIKRVERERDFLNAEPPGDRKNQERQRIEAIEKAQQVNRLKAELRRMQGHMAGE